MLRKLDGSEQITTAPARIMALDRARTCITLLVLLHHSVVNYTYFGNGDRARWLGFDLVVLFNDSFFMACMFFISGLFVCDSLTRKGPAIFLGERAWRLGVPFLLSIFVLMPIAYYPTFLRYHLPGTTDFNFLHFWWHTLTIGPWPSGPVWFLWVLLALDAIAALVWSFASGAIGALGRLIFSLRNRATLAFIAFLIFSVAIYLPMRLAFGDASWLEPGGYPLPIQTSRILLYAGYFFTGVGVGAVSLRTGVLAENGDIVKRWLVWAAFALLFYAAILALVYIHHNWVADLNSPPLSWRVGYGVTFALFSAAMTFAEPAMFLRFANANWRWMDALRPSAYGVFLVHYIFIIWLQYAVYDYSWPPGVKFAVVFAGTLSLSWTLIVLLRKIPFVARMI
ncbi:acyltransferase family protein [Bradyrhizobium canariense]|uniref:Acyltransferase family protein n=1 Tax=Bradyrhizobium canariense TaxID=255045 RepID=A0A1H1WEI5_9BRAD|nr:acyltransferase [Bradyrhizobium canariense]SDS94766.1 Acyltransferase family protein [Bradyrhizobium canariense]